jgi:uncharacterized protein YjiS (DUF1127 family)
MDPKGSIMSVYSARPVDLHRSTTGFPSRRRSRFQRLAAAVAGLWRRMAEYDRMRRDAQHLDELTDHELRDIGLRRIGPGRFVTINDAEGG